MGDMAYFPAYFSYARTLEGLTDEQFGHVMRAAIQYAEHGTIPELNALEKMGFAFIKEDIDRANERYQKVCETNKRNIQKRWAKKQVEEPVEHTDGDTVVYGRMDAIPDHTNVYETYQSNSNSKSKRKAKENAIATATTTGADGARVVGGGDEKKSGFEIPNISDVAEYCVKQGYTHVDVEGFVKFYDDNGWTVGDGEPMKSWKAVLRGWEERAKNKPKPAANKPAATSFETDDFFDAALQRTYGDNWQMFKDAGG